MKSHSDFKNFYSTLRESTFIFLSLDSQQIEETGENVRKELKKAFRMEVDISTKELMRKHERLAREVSHNFLI